MPLYEERKKDEPLKMEEVGVDLKLMIDELDSVEVPSVFICPISLEPMQDPVTLCTGQTYDRSNILKWLSLGHKTCPTTMQELWDDSLTPNTTLSHLILTWFSHKHTSMKKSLEDVQGRALRLLDTLKRVKGQARVRALQDLRELVGSHSNARKALEENGGVALVFSLLGPFTSHAVGSEAVGIIVGLDLSYDQLKGSLMHPAKVSLLVDIMNEGTIDTKMNCAKLIEMLLVEGSNEVVSSLSLLVGLLRLVRDKKHPTGVVSTGLILLKAIVCSHESVRISMISLGGIPLLIDLLPSFNNECLEVALYILEVLSTLEEGRMALKECPNIIPNVVKYLMRVSERCTQFALSILWAIYKLAPEECASQAVEAGLAAKLLLVIQSGCNPVLKQMSSEFLKLCSLNYSTSILISKCMLTSTIQ